MNGLLRIAVDFRKEELAKGQRLTQAANLTLGLALPAHRKPAAIVFQDEHWRNDAALPPRDSQRVTKQKRVVLGLTGRSQMPLEDLYERRYAWVVGRRHPLIRDRVGNSVENPAIRAKLIAAVDL
jgi:hypothetical protein